MPRSVHERAARRILRYGSTTPLPEHTQVVCDMIGYLENWAAPERIAAGRAAAVKVHERRHIWTHIYIGQRLLHARMHERTFMHTYIQLHGSFGPSGQLVVRRHPIVQQKQSDATERVPRGGFNFGLPAKS